MTKYERFAEVPQIKKGVAFSDPSYDASVWCQYRKEFQASDWVMKMESTRDEYDYVDFTLMLGRKTCLSGTSINETEQGKSFSYYKHYGVKEAELGCDTASIFVGSLDNFENWAEEGSVYTAADGLFGNLYEFGDKVTGEPAGYLLIGSVDSAVTNEDDLFQTIRSSFDAIEVSKERYEQLTDKEDFDLKLDLAKEIAQANALEKNGRDNRAKGKEGLDR